MKHFLIKLCGGMTTTSQRRRRPRMIWTCEVVEARLVLSAVNGITVLDLPAVASDAAGSSQSNVVQNNGQGHQPGVRDQSITAPSAIGAATPDSSSRAVEGTGTQSPTSRDSGGQPTPGSVSSGTGDVNAGAPQGAGSQTNPSGEPRPGSDPSQPPPQSRADSALTTTSSDVASSVDTVNSTLSTIASSSSFAVSNAGVAMSTEDSAENTVDIETPSAWFDQSAVEGFWHGGHGGFIDIPGPRSDGGALSEIPLPGTSEAPGTSPNRAAGQTDLVDPQDLRSNLETDESEAAVAAAIEFFNQQTAGGFVDLGLEELTAVIGNNAPSPAGFRTGLESSIGWLDPFDDGREPVLLTGTEQAAVSGPDNGRTSESAAHADLTMAGVVFGVAGLRSRTSRRFLESIRRLLRRLGTVATGE